MFFREWKMLDFLRYMLLPPLMIIFFTGITQFLVSLGNPHRFYGHSAFKKHSNIVRVWSPESLLSPGYTFSWLVVVF